VQSVSIVQLKYFLLVAESASYRQAAERAHRSQSAISRAIQELEQRLGARLLNESNRVSLTPAGQACLPIVRDLVQHFDRAVESIRHSLASTHGVLSIGGTSTAATRLLPSIVRAFRERFPLVELRLVDDNSVKLRDMVRSGELDWALCSLLTPDPQLSFLPLMSDPFGFVCGRRHPLAARKSLAWKEIADQPLIRTTVHDHLLGTPAQALLDRSKLSVSTMISVWALLRAGEGVTVLPAHSAPEPETGLVFIPLRAPVLRRSMGLLKLVDGHVTPASQAFEEVAREQFRRLSGKGLRAS